MMPPKKSKAAREKALADEHEEKSENGGASSDSNKPAVEIVSLSGRKNRKEDAADDHDDEEKINVFKVEIIDGKRKRNLPASESKLEEWVTDNFEEKEDKHLVMGEVYECYLSMCTSTATPAFEFMSFIKALKQKFPKGFICKEDSPYQEAIKEKKEKKKKTTTDGVKVESIQKKMKNIITEVINDMGNFKKGFSFRSLKNNIIGRYPALRLDLHPNLLKVALARGVYRAEVELVRGVGICGYYRLPGASTKEEPEEDDKKKKKAASKKSKETTDKDQENEKNGEADNAEKTGEEDEGQDENKENKEERKSAKTDEKSKGGDKKKGKKGKKKKSSHKSSHNAPFHGNPERIEDTFPLAMTFMSEPKEASIGKIRKYIQRYYRRDLNLEKFKKVIADGLEKGLWDQVSGSGMYGTFRLEIDEFDPTDDDDLIGQIINAIMACTEPKVSSAIILRRYIQDFHPEFKVAEKPYLFKKSLERAIKKDKICQISGLGAAGSFRLAQVFTPSPTILQGRDTESDYEDDTDFVVGRDPEEVDVTQYRDAYVPRPSKRHGRKAAIRDLDKDLLETDSVVVLSSQKKSALSSQKKAAKPARAAPRQRKTPSQPKKRSTGARGGKAPMDDSDDDIAEPPKKKKVPTATLR